VLVPEVLEVRAVLGAQAVPKNEGPLPEWMFAQATASGLRVSLFHGDDAENKYYEALDRTILPEAFHVMPDSSSSISMWVCTGWGSVDPSAEFLMGWLRDAPPVHTTYTGRGGTALSHDDYRKLKYLYSS
jgi:hypothetical protein